MRIYFQIKFNGYKNDKIFSFSNKPEGIRARITWSAFSAPCEIRISVKICPDTRRPLILASIFSPQTVVIPSILITIWIQNCQAIFKKIYDALFI